MDSRFQRRFDNDKLDWLDGQLHQGVCRVLAVYVVWLARIRFYPTSLCGVLPSRRRLQCAALHPVALRAALRAALRTALRRDRCSTSQSINVYIIIMPTSHVAQQSERAWLLYITSQKHMSPNKCISFSLSLRFVSLSPSVSALWCKKFFGAKCPSCWRCSGVKVLGDNGFLV